MAVASVVVRTHSVVARQCRLPVTLRAPAVHHVTVLLLTCGHIASEPRLQQCVPAVDGVVTRWSVQWLRRAVRQCRACFAVHGRRVCP